MLCRIDRPIRRFACLGAVILALSGIARAQTACRTAACSVGAPAACLARATPRTLEVLMTGDGIGTPLQFVPADPKIEPNDCISAQPAAG